MQQPIESDKIVELKRDFPSDVFRDQEKEPIGFPIRSRDYGMVSDKATHWEYTILSTFTICHNLAGGY